MEVFWDDEYLTDSSDEFWDGDDIHDTSSGSSLPIDQQQFPGYDVEIAAYQMGGKNAPKFPAADLLYEEPPADLLLRKEDMKIEDVVKQHVLPFLPAKSLKKFQAVSKEWNQWIGSPLLTFRQSFSFQKLSGYFYQKLDNFQSNPEFLSLDHSAKGVPSPSLSYMGGKVKVLSSSSGLLLCQGRDDYYVCNPATKDRKKLPRPQYYHGSDPAVVLAFEPQCNIESVYHIIAAVPLLGQPVVIFEIYSSASNSWRCSSSDCFELEYTTLKGGGFYMKGVAYWNTSATEVLAFDLKNEISAVLHVPIQSGRHGALTLIGDEVCYVTAYNHTGNVFVMDIYGGTDMSLKRSVSANIGPQMPISQACEILPCINSDTVVIHTNAKIYCYHLKKHKVEIMKSPGPVAPNSTRFLPYVNSLVMVT